MDGYPVSFDANYLNDFRAEIRLVDENTEKVKKLWTVPLVDNGYGVPDLTSNDGIFSGAFIPDQDGVYKITVLINSNEYVFGKSSNKNVGLHKHGDIWNPLLLPNDPDVWFGCGSNGIGCWIFTPDYDVSKVVEYSTLIHVKNVNNYKVSCKSNVMH